MDMPAGSGCFRPHRPAHRQSTRLREIRITNVPDPVQPTAPISLRQIDVTIFYSVGSARLRETVTTYVANYNN